MINIDTPVLLFNIGVLSILTTELLTGVLIRESLRNNDLQFSIKKPILNYILAFIFSYIIGYQLLINNIDIKNIDSSYIKPLIIQILLFVGLTSNLTDNLYGKVNRYSLEISIIFFLYLHFITDIHNFIYSLIFTLAIAILGLRSEKIGMSDYRAINLILVSIYFFNEITPIIVILSFFVFDYMRKMLKIENIAGIFIFFEAVVITITNFIIK